MIDFGERQNIAPGILLYFIDLDPIGHKLHGINHQRNPMQKIWFSLYLLGILLLDIPIKLLLLLTRNNIPGLGRPKVVIVQRINKQILNMPAERSELHAHVHPRRGHATDLIVFQVDDFQH